MYLNIIRKIEFSCFCQWCLVYGFKKAAEVFGTTGLSFLRTFTLWRIFFLYHFTYSLDFIFISVAMQTGEQLFFFYNNCLSKADSPFSSDSSPHLQTRFLSLEQQKFSAGKRHFSCVNRPIPNTKLSNYITSRLTDAY